MVANKQDKKPLTAANWSPGTKSDQSAYRSKLTGVDSILSALAILVKHHKITSGEITIALDCDTALKTCPPNKPLNIQQPSFDVLQDIRNRIKMLPIVIKWRWVEGHQKEKGKKWTGGQDKILRLIWLPKISFENAAAINAPSDQSDYFTNIGPFTTRKQNNHALTQKDYTNKSSTRKLATIGELITVS